QRRVAFDGGDIQLGAALQQQFGQLAGGAENRREVITPIQLVGVSAVIEQRLHDNLCAIELLLRRSRQPHHAIVILGGGHGGIERAGGIDLVALDVFCAGSEQLIDDLDIEVAASPIERND